MRQESVNDATVDPAEVDRYRRLADMWWQEDGKLWPLHVLNQLRTTWIRDQLCRALDQDATAEQPLQGLRVLDIGCGGGLLSESMARMGATVHGVDVVDTNIMVAQGHAREQGLSIDYQVATAEALATRSEQYDVVLNMEVVEHVADLSAFMQAVNALVRPGGYTFVATINRNMISFVVAIVGAEYLFRLLPRGTHQWRRFPTPAELTALLQEGRLAVVERTGVKVNPLNRRMWLSPSLSVNYMLMARREEKAK
ncbi:2-polyprenyl-6-hydroxyphenyl methylase/3-demethylubiquinone-9 3-methyltransferase [Natronocella acetinitrilica]|uniref:Ubiquinone biosynthesis O-methyltransferase n=1 Tax=Natronocella acetinitrilica TaxID=414046 RepID=A0AAE3KC92_9GAMM|nr:bifunctional 2-polyprenyl-6-hydroxyphenol methylase/3-demethylubiquinol 3-O-methyltransferase UbiG [Natronocella acetinitrilica]MCP1675514.1 2-polyprenyl-6-hydroxyphenyl methylase/3-demethylubiquinone-9 3-methyltransferase [Natronocella acetinitrilica]